MNYMEEDKAVRNFIIIFVIVLLFVVGLFFVTKLINKENESTEDNNTTKEVQIDNSVAIVGTMLQKSDKEYYVILYKSDDSKSSEYAALVTKYKAKTDVLPLYVVDLSNALNKKYYDKENTNFSADDVNDLRFGDITVLKVNSGKITNTYNTVEKIEKIWKIS